VIEAAPAVEIVAVAATDANVTTGASLRFAPVFVYHVDYLFPQAIEREFKLSISYFGPQVFLKSLFAA